MSLPIFSEVMNSNYVSLGLHSLVFANSFELSFIFDKRARVNLIHWWVYFLGPTSTKQQGQSFLHLAWQGWTCIQIAIQGLQAMHANHYTAVPLHVIAVKLESFNPPSLFHNPSCLVNHTTKLTVTEKFRKLTWLKCLGAVQGKSSGCEIFKCLSNYMQLNLCFWLMLVNYMLKQILCHPMLVGWQVWHRDHFSAVCHTSCVDLL